MTISKEEQIWRIHGEAKEINTLVFIGNGCVVNGWEPLRHAIAKEDKSSIYAGDPLLSLILTASHARRSLRGLTANLQGQGLQKIPNHIENLSKIHQVRESIGNLYKEASINKRVGDDPFTLNISVDLYDILCQMTTLTITTNWDCLLWNDKKIKNLIQLHGLSSTKRTSQSILFPTELKTDYQQLYFLNDERINNDSRFSEIKEDIAYRAEVLFDAEILTKLPVEKTNLIKNVKKIILAGIKINDYDVELIGILSFVRSKLADEIEKQTRDKLEEIEIINPNNQDADRAAIILSGVSKYVIQKYEKKTRIIHVDS